MTTPFPFGPQIRVTDYNPLLGFGLPTYDSVAISGLAYGNFITVWEEFADGPGFPEQVVLYARILNGDGSPAGDRFQIASDAFFPFASGVFQPGVALLDNEQFVVSWTQSNASASDASGTAIMAQRFNLFGPVGAAFTVNTTTADDQSQSTVAALSGGRFVISWADDSATGSDLSGSAIRAQVFDANGLPSGTEFLVNTTTSGNQSNPTITGLSGGGFVISWQDDSETGQDTSESAVRGQVFQSDGTPSGAEFLVNTTTSGAQADPTITGLSGGGFVVSWIDTSETGLDTSGSAVRGQVFEPDGTPAGAEFLVNTITDQGQQVPSIAALPDGRFVVNWTDFSTSGMGDFLTTRGQLFNADGSRSGDEFFIDDSNFPELIWFSDVTPLADGRFVVATWDDGGGINAQTYDPRDSAVQLSGTSRADYLVGTLFDDRISGRLGDDTLLGEAGNDQLFGNAGNDWLYGGADNDRLWGNAGNDNLFGGAGNDILNGGSGVDHMEGGAGNDIHIVDHADDVVIEHAFQGVDQVRSSTISLNLNLFDYVENARVTGSLDLDVTGDNTSNRLSGNAGDNVIWGQRGSDVILAKAGDDVVIGGYGDDLILGQAGNDRLAGNFDDDTLIGGTGRDVQTGGQGNDDFVFRNVDESGTTSSTRDRISDFVQGEDRIDLSAIDASVAIGGNQAFEFVGTAAFSGTAGELRYTTVGSRTHVQADVDGDSVSDFEIGLSGLLVLTAGDFVL